MIQQTCIIRNAIPEEYLNIGAFMAYVYSKLDGFPMRNESFRNPTGISASENQLEKGLLLLYGNTQANCRIAFHRQSGLIGFEFQIRRYVHSLSFIISGSDKNGNAGNDHCRTRYHQKYTPKFITQLVPVVGVVGVY